MNLLGVMQQQQGGTSYFDTLARFHTSRSLQIFENAKNQPMGEAQKKVRESTLALYQGMASDLGMSVYSGGSAKQGRPPITDRRLIKVVDKIINAELSFGEKKIFMDELLAEFGATANGKKDAFLAKVDDLLKAAEKKSEFEGTATEREKQLLRLYYAQEASGVDTTQQMSLLDFLG